LAGVTIQRQFRFSGFRATADPFRRLARAADVNLAFEKGPVFDADAVCYHISGKRSLTTNVQTVAGVNIANNLALYNDFLRVIVAATCPLRPTVTQFPGRLIDPSTLPSM